MNYFLFLIQLNGRKEIIDRENIFKDFDKVFLNDT